MENTLQLSNEIFAEEKGKEPKIEDKIVKMYKQYVNYFE